MTIEVHGTCDPRFEAVRGAFASNLESGLDVGASFAATLEGEMVVDLWGGWPSTGAARLAARAAARMGAGLVTVAVPEE